MPLSIRFLPPGFQRQSLTRRVEKVLAGEKKKEAGLTVVFLESRPMAELNFRYRRKKGATDVLAFPADKALPRTEHKTESYLGEVVVCLPQIWQNARKYKESFSQEFRRVLLHGVLHLLGYDHEQSRRKAAQMKKKEEEYLS